MGVGRPREPRCNAPITGDVERGLPPYNREILHDVRKYEKCAGTEGVGARSTAALNWLDVPNIGFNK